MRSRETMTLGLFFNHTGHHVASWRHPDAQADAGVNIRHYLDMARTAEQSKFDFLFFADQVAVREAHPDALSRSAQYTAHFEPLTLLSALSVVTDRIGLVATASTSYNEPYHLARKFASLDHLSGGRAGWNVVTSTAHAEAQNFGRDQHYDHAERYDRAHEFLDVVRGLWDSWDDDAFIRDKQSGAYFDPTKLHALEHKGKHFKIRGPLNVPRPIQGHPVIVQAGSSEDGREFAAATAEIVFTAEMDLASAQQYYRDVKGRMARYGRRPEHLHVLTGINPIVGRTEAEANEKHEHMQSLIHPIVGREILSTMLGGADLSSYSLDGPLPDLPQTDASKSGLYQNIVKLAQREKLTIRQLYLRLAGARGKLTIKGSVEQVVDKMEEWFRQGGSDGFIVQPSHLPGSLDEFATLAIPELQRRGLFHRDYDGETLRDGLGLPRPESRYRLARQTP